MKLNVKIKKIKARGISNLISPFILWQTAQGLTHNFEHVGYI
jgi:hypothetical protein